jgi:hypothetical protein
MLSKDDNAYPFPQKNEARLSSGSNVRFFERGRRTSSADAGSVAAGRR